MESNAVVFPLLGGGLIGLAVTLMLLFNGRVTGISGIVYSALSKPTSTGIWRWFFIGGLLLGGVVMSIVSPDSFINSSGRSPLVIAIAGLLVGFGTVMGSGCTSGHGVCGISRWSVRSALATVIFIFFGFIAVQFFSFVFGGAL